MKRLEAWKEAVKLVNPIIEQHELKQYSPNANIFASGTSVVTPAAQHIDHIIDVAEWLIEGETDA